MGSPVPSDAGEAGTWIPGAAKVEIRGDAGSGPLGVAVAASVCNQRRSPTNAIAHLEAGRGSCFARIPRSGDPDPLGISRHAFGLGTRPHRDARTRPPRAPR